MTAYADLLTIQTLNTGDVLTAALMTQVRNNGEFFIDPPACSVFNSTAISAATSGTAVLLTADSEFFDNSSIHSTSSQTSRLTMATTGRYLTIATVAFQANATGNRQLDLYVNGVALPGGILIDNAGASNSTGLVMARAPRLVAGDYIELKATQRSGGALDVTLTEFAAYFMTR